MKSIIGAYRIHAISLLAPLWVVACAAPVQSSSNADDAKENDAREPAPSTSDRAPDAPGGQHERSSGDNRLGKVVQVDRVIGSARLRDQPAGRGDGFVPFGTFTSVQGFEGSSPWNSWDESQSGDGVTGYDINLGVAKSGQNNGWLKAGNGWAANRIPFYISNIYPRNSCEISLSARALGSGGVVGLQIWNPNGWTVIASTYPWVNGNGAGYQYVGIGQLNLSSLSGNIYAQVIYSNNSGVQQFIRVDEMVLNCYY